MLHAHGFSRWLDQTRTARLPEPADNLNPSRGFHGRGAAGKPKIELNTASCCHTVFISDFI
ncbi:hypothetical protein FM101_10110 [Arthrobacter rhombi]|uniref:Uncharacterized protein n=1 Tax=Arthrobacter rhombi TaxID=71253 RepID=A0A1R4GFH6_9MICC|nr:hypothetical protein FM101_10110 [Arthrobacter rhombi]